MLVELISYSTLLVSETNMPVIWNGKPLGSLKKDELILYIAEQEEKNSELLTNMAKEIVSLKVEVTSLKDVTTIRAGFDTRLIDIERRIALQEQYSRRECIDLVNIPEEIPENELEGTVIEIFKTAGVKVSTRDFHAIHRKRNKTTVIAKLVNRRDTIDILRAKAFVRNFNPETKKRLNLSNDKKIYINENLCPSFSRLMGISNQLFKQKAVTSFYSVNGLLRLKLLDGSFAAISHIEDLRKLFGDLVDNIMKNHEVARKAARR